MFDLADERLHDALERLVDELHQADILQSPAVTAIQDMVRMAKLELVDRADRERRLLMFLHFLTEHLTSGKAVSAQHREALRDNLGRLKLAADDHERATGQPMG